MKRKAHYPLTHTEIITFRASSGAQQVSIDNVFLGPVPEIILTEFVRNTTFVGCASTNTFHFHHYYMTKFVFFVNGVQNPSEPLTMDCFTTIDATRPFETLFSNTGIQHDDRVHMITMEMLTKVFYVLRFYLAP